MQRSRVHLVERSQRGIESLDRIARSGEENIGNWHFHTSVGQLLLDKLKQAQRTTNTRFIVIYALAVLSEQRRKLQHPPRVLRLIVNLDPRCRHETMFRNDRKKKRSENLFLTRFTSRLQSAPFLPGNMIKRALNFCVNKIEIHERWSIYVRIVEGMKVVERAGAM